MNGHGRLLAAAISDKSTRLSESRVWLVAVFAALFILSVICIAVMVSRGDRDKRAYFHKELSEAALRYGLTLVSCDPYNGTAFIVGTDGLRRRCTFRFDRSRWEYVLLHENTELRPLSRSSL